MHRMLFTFPLITTLMLPVAAQAAVDIKRGEELLTQRCYGCHGEDVYVREKRLVKDFPGLQKRVNFCVQQVNVSWFEDEITDVIEFLNTEYYHFKK